MMNGIALIFLLLLSLPVAANASATIQLPKTGQTKCYDATGAVIACAGTGQDGETQLGASLPVPRYTDNGDGTVTDNYTGLIWLKDANCTALNPGGNGVAWGDALVAANGLHSGQCGLNDNSMAGTWRLPNLNELESLIDLSLAGFAVALTDPAVPIRQVGGIDYTNNPFADSLASTMSASPANPEYWMSTLNPEYPNDAEGINLYNGSARSSNRTDLKHVWAVKGTSSKVPKTGQANCWKEDATLLPNCSQTPGADGDLQKGAVWPAPRFIDNHNGTLTDKLTGLTWPKEFNCFNTDMTWEQAVTAAKDLVSGHCGLNDGSTAGQWRVPNQKEMRSLVHYGIPNATDWFSSQGFTNPMLGWYWTSDHFAQAGFDVRWLVKSEGGTWLSDDLQRIPQQVIKMLLPVRGGLSATVTIDGATLNQSYDGNPKSISASTNPAGLPVITSYAGSATAPTAAGSYPVVVTVDDPTNTYLGEATGTLTISKLPGTVTIDTSTLTQTWSGTPKVVTSTTVPAGAAVTYSYEGGSTPPTEPGTYAVVATMTSYTGTDSRTLTINKVTPEISWATPAGVPSGTALSAAQLNATASVGGQFAYTPAAGTVPAAGDQLLTVIFTPTDTAHYTTATASVHLLVDTAYTVTFTTDGHGTITGTASQPVSSGGSAAAVQAVPSSGYSFIKWTGTGGFASTDNPLTVTNVLSNLTITANFGHRVQATVQGGNGTITCTPIVAHGDSCTCSVTPAAGYHLVTLTDNGADKLATVDGTGYTIPGVAADHTVIASFARPDGIVIRTDGKTTPSVSDALAVLKMVNGVTPATAADKARCDVAPRSNDGRPMGNGVLDIYDVIGILRMAIGQF